MDTQDNLKENVLNGICSDYDHQIMSGTKFFTTVSCCHSRYISHSEAFLDISRLAMFNLYKLVIFLNLPTYL